LFVTLDDDIKALDDLLVVVMQVFIFAIKAEVFIQSASFFVAPVLYLFPSATVAQDCTRLGEPLLPLLCYGCHLSVLFYLYFLFNYK
jgi:hypothetical protein